MIFLELFGRILCTPQVTIAKHREESYPLAKSFPQFSVDWPLTLSTVGEAVEKTFQIEKSVTISVT